jgi:SAM-dependent methyltransferase
MHHEVKDYVFHAFHNWLRGRQGVSVLEVGSLDINGSVREIIQPFAGSYLGIDMQKGPGVDLVADGASYELPEAYDVVVTAETFEHTPVWKDIINKSYINLKPDGIFIATMAGEGRPPHSAIDENPIRDWEHYANIGAWELKQALKKFKVSDVNVLKTDLRCFAIK